MILNLPIVFTKYVACVAQQVRSCAPYVHGHRQLDSSHNPKHVHFTFQSITLIRNPRLKYNNLRIEASPWIPNQLEASGCLQCMYGGAIFKFFSNFFQTFQMRITFPQGSFPRHFTTSLFTCG